MSGWGNRVANRYIVLTFATVSLNDMPGILLSGFVTGICTPADHIANAEQAGLSNSFSGIIKNHISPNVSNLYDLTPLQ